MDGAFLLRFDDYMIAKGKKDVKQERLPLFIKARL
jgi:hypothetical protein